MVGDLDDVGQVWVTWMVFESCWWVTWMMLVVGQLDDVGEVVGWMIFVGDLDGGLGSYLRWVTWIM